MSKKQALFNIVSFSFALLCTFTLLHNILVLISAEEGFYSHTVDGLWICLLAGLCQITICQIG